MYQGKYAIVKRLNTWSRETFSPDYNVSVIIKVKEDGREEDLKLMNSFFVSGEVVYPTDLKGSVNATVSHSDIYEDFAQAKVMFLLE